MEVSVYFNPACSNCRTVEGILNEKGVDAEYVRYLDSAPQRADLEKVLALLGTDDPRAIVREKEPVYAELGLGDREVSDDELIALMVEHPQLLQRPIVERDDRAVLARPPERVLELLD